ncbi:phage tail tape measure protein [Aureliella helgolandensis]|uniref:Phage-related minor tail protein n=1 Tax=Aureliella helgolandensis TaxID=2527968 RepID=A0A518G4A7_9BACT|nr:phage tail tape measure protein [Aureliella helgolandensis]QDV23427.1 hypothetical protein Q31a_17250 [Aureliella helgolandensis]
MAGKDVKAGEAFVEVSLRSKIGAGAKKVQDQLKSVSRSLGTAGAALTGLGGAVIAPLFAAASKFASAGDAIEKMAARTGVAAETLSELQFAAGQSGSSIETVEKSIRKMQQTLVEAADGSASQIEALNAIGLSAEELAGKTPIQQFEMFAEAISKIEDPTERAARSMDIFGRSGTELLPMFANGAAGIRDLRKEARDLGHQLTTEDAAAAAALTDAWGRISATMKGIVLQLGAAVAPALTTVANAVKNVLAVVVKWITNNRQLVVILAAVALGVTTTGVALLGLAGAASAAAFVIGSIISLTSILAGLLNPVTLIIIAAGAAYLAMAGAIVYAMHQTGALEAAIKYLSFTFGQIVQVAKKVSVGISAALSAGQHKLAAKILFAGLQVIFLKGLNALQTVWRLALFSMAKYMLDLAKRLPGLLLNALRGVNGISGLVSGALSSVKFDGFDVSKPEAELTRLLSLADQLQNQGSPRIPGGAPARHQPTRRPLPRIPPPATNRLSPQQAFNLARQSQQQLSATRNGFAQTGANPGKEVAFSTANLEKLAQAQLGVLRRIAGLPPIVLPETRF